MLTKITIVTGLVSAAVSLAVLFGWNLTPDQLAGIQAFIIAVGGAIHAWVNPNVPFGNTGG